MKASQILRIAAKRIEDAHNTFACCAIDDSYRNGPAQAVCDAINYFAGYFKPHRPDSLGRWFGDERKQINQDRRILALCFAAAIAESEGD